MFPRGHLPVAILVFLLSPAGAQVPAELRPWLDQQTWKRDMDGPVVSLGSAGEFDDTHIFAPAVARNGDAFWMWYCGSRGAVEERVFRLGLATSADGRLFEKRAGNPIYEFGDGRHSVLTPAVLRSAEGKVLREDGKLRMWFSSTWFQEKGGLHGLHETFSEDGIHWERPSPVLFKDAYAPAVIKTGRTYQMWYTDVGSDPWLIRHATSLDGRKWRRTLEPALQLDQQWERGRLFYPEVLKIDGSYLMWYGAYWSARPDTTAVGFAASLDGMRWYKHPQNPVFRPDPRRPWESHYVTSHSVIPLAAGGFRMWYASRKSPPFVNKYFAINTARWDGPGRGAGRDPVPGDPGYFTDPPSFFAWKEKTQMKLRALLGIPSRRVPLKAESRGRFEHDGIIVERWVFTSEPGSRVPAVLYRPKGPPAPMPAIVLTFGHGGSKSAWQYNYAGQVYARLGLACLALDPIGEEERHVEGRLGTRAHDPKPVHDRADRAGRLIMGKLIFDTMRGIDFLEERGDIDPRRIGVAGNSLGGAKAGWMAALEPRIRMAVVSGWAFQDITLRTKYCTKVPNQRMREICTWPEYLSLAAPGCSVWIANGDADWIIDGDNDGSAWEGTRSAVDRAGRTYEMLGVREGIQAWFEKDGGHRPYFIYKEALVWIHRHLGTPGWSLEQILALPTINSGRWCDAQGIRLERLYGTALHQRGATLPDFGLRPIPREKLACLDPEERGSPEFTLEGWLKVIEGEL